MVYIFTALDGVTAKLVAGCLSGYLRWGGRCGRDHTGNAIACGILVK
jgi:hypothetical protein